MSFGRAGGRPRTDPPCPCGGDAFGRCCGPFLAGAAAPSAAQLMRSRYTAYAVLDTAHLVRTWHPRTRPERLDLDPDTVWDGLVVHDAVEAGDAAVVAFTASWHDGEQQGKLTERSRFERRGGRWVYLDGDVG